MFVLKKSWLLALAICMAMVASFQGGHAFDQFKAVEESECCASGNGAHEDEESHSSHECCQSSVAVLIPYDLVVPLSSVASAEAADLSFHGGMVKESDYPPQLV